MHEQSLTHSVRLVLAKTLLKSGCRFHGLRRNLVSEHVGERFLLLWLGLIHLFLHESFLLALIFTEFFVVDKLSINGRLCRLVVKNSSAI